METIVDGVDLLGRIPGETWRAFLPVPYDLQVCGFFATGVYDDRKHHAEWLDDILTLSRFEPDTAFVKATFRRLGELEPHVDRAGFNYLWIHQGKGFVFEGKLLDLEPGSVVRFARDREHGVVATDEPYYRTNLIGQVGIDAIEDWDSAFPTTCWIQDGEVFDRDGRRDIPWSTV
ncbi:hypothetical protein [Kitasatospora sp. NPDC097643]|uniref:hypothetical protein n=1 Tax=Kitasatospora sp. NPDC097643 TaxID=3157230 RepID=UPI00332494CE